MEKNDDYIKGRGAQINSLNPFDKYTVVREHPEGIDTEEDNEAKMRSEYIEVFPKTIINKVESPDLGMYSMNPYQGCEHGCIYCYARNTHNYWGYSAGTDFERKILVKKMRPSCCMKPWPKANGNQVPLCFQEIRIAINRRKGISSLRGIC